MARSVRLRQPPQDRRQDPALAVVVDVDRPVEAGDGAEPPLAAIVGSDGDGHAGPRSELGQTVDLVFLAAGEPERCGSLARLELEWQHAHPDEVAAMDPLE